MIVVRFDVNDAGLRDAFLRETALNTIRNLDEAAAPRWGQMTAHQMIEHLLWAVELSNGRVHTECLVPDAELPRMKRFLYSNRPGPRDFPNPALARGLPPLRHESSADATAGFRRELERFLSAHHEPARLFTHPIFGALNHEEWHRTHYKHLHHHLEQFGLIESGYPHDLPRDRPP
jgi:oxepin-CoA hydrolase/3-oxo-5,6-dehydrosuberyl-CoA semialdehyde dehydrogenase